jgi:TetR/AcrR family transcriptional repressor of nem operon
MQETPRKGSDTRERILDVAEAAVLEKGFAATSIEELIAAVGITKSGFFYHFKDKNELAKALLVRYVEREEAIRRQVLGDGHSAGERHGCRVRPTHSRLA